MSLYGDGINSVVNAIIIGYSGMCASHA